MINQVIDKMISAKEEQNAWNNLIIDAEFQILEAVVKKHNFKSSMSLSVSDANRLLGLLGKYRKPHELELYGMSAKVFIIAVNNSKSCIKRELVKLVKVEF